MTDNKRQYPRFSFPEPVSYQSQELPNGSLAGNISVGGLKLSVHEFVPLGTVLEVQIAFSNPIRVVNVKTKVVWVKEIAYSERYELGLEFIRERATLEVIEEYVNARRFEPI